MFSQDIEGLVKNIVINPYWLGSVLKKIFRHDMNEDLKFTESIRKKEFNQIQFEQEKKELLDNGVITENLLR